MTLRKIVFAVAAVLAVALLAAPALWAQEPGSADPNTVAPDEHILGAADAPITIIEYSSLTCPHCASFHRETLPELKENWIEPGKARLVYRHYPLDRLALRAAMVAECLEGRRYFSFLDLLFKQQQRWARADDPIDALSKLARMGGIGPDDFKTCVQDEPTARRILERQVAARNTFDVQSTPTFIVEGQKVSGAQPYAEFEKLLESLDSQS